MDESVTFYAGFTHAELVQTVTAMEDALRTARAALATQKRAADRVILEIADERDQARQDRNAARACVAELEPLAEAAVAWFEDAEEFTNEHALMDAIRAEIARKADR
jgi:multidrug resistance efflux pump